MWKQRYSVKSGLRKGLRVADVEGNHNRGCALSGFGIRDELNTPAILRLLATTSARNV